MVPTATAASNLMKAIVTFSFDECGIAFSGRFAKLPKRGTRLGRGEFRLFPGRKWPSR